MAVLDPLTSAFRLAAGPITRQLADTLAGMFRDNLRLALVRSLEATSVPVRGAPSERRRARRAKVVERTPSPAAEAPVSVASSPAEGATPPTPTVAAAPPADRVVRTPIVIRVPPKRRRAERRSSEQIEILENRILRALGAQPSLRLDAIADAVGAGRGTLTWPISRLIAARKVVSSGEPGASVYALAPPPPPTVTRIIRRPAAAAPKVASEAKVSSEPAPRAPTDQVAGLLPQPT